MLPPGARKFALVVHLASSVGWVGVVIAYLALGLAATYSDDPSLLRASWLAMELVGWYVLVPRAIGALLTGLVMALGTKWGLFRYYGVLFALVLTSLTTVVLVLHMPDVSARAEVARTADTAVLDELGGDLFHASMALVVLLVILVLNVYKPPGMTRYRWRRQQERAHRLDHAQPRWSTRGPAST